MQTVASCSCSAPRRAAPLSARHAAAGVRLPVQPTVRSAAQCGTGAGEQP